MLTARLDGLATPDERYDVHGPASRGDHNVTALLKNPLIWGTFLGVWVVAAVVWTIASRVAPDSFPAVSGIVPASIFRSFICVMALLIGWASSSDRRFSALRDAVWGLSLFPLALSDTLIDWAGWRGPPIDAVVAQLSFRLSIIFGFVAIGRFGRHLLRYQQANAELSAARARFDQTEARSLQVRLQPLFLMQCLDEISRRMRADPVDADSFLLEVSELLRQTLRRLDSGPVRLEDEARYLSEHVHIARSIGRMTGSLRFDVDDQLQRALVPPACLQALLEQLESHRPPGGDGEIDVKASASPTGSSIVLAMATADASAGTNPPRDDGQRFSLRDYMTLVVGVGIHEFSDGGEYRVWLEVPRVFEDGVPSVALHSSPG
jgi:hypothetical protein